MLTNMARCIAGVKKILMPELLRDGVDAGAAEALPTVADRFGAQVRASGMATALQEGSRRWSYGELDERVNRLARALTAWGVTRGARVAVLSENRAEYVEVKLAAAKLGAIVACQNWRQADAELAYCLNLVTPAVLVHSPRYRPLLGRIATDAIRTLCLGEDYEALLARSDPSEPPRVARPEDPLTLLYTSGTTGRPKAALISHRALIARAQVHALDQPVECDDAFLAWTPFFHMGGSDFVLSTLMRGAKVIVMDGFDAAEMVRIAASEQLGWLQIVPGMADRLLDELQSSGLRPKATRYIGVMADLVSRPCIAELTRRFQAPYVNTFGSTEAAAMASRGRIAVGEVAQDLAKEPSSLCAIRLVDPDDKDVADGAPGEMLVRSASLFSGYWQAPEINAEVLRDGWFHTGDVFVRRPDGRLDFVDRRKYLIKSGGENVYPAEIERLLLRSPRIADAVVVRCPDSTWGEVPVAFVVRRDRALTAADVLALLDGELARYKRPRDVRFVAAAELPRGSSGKIIRGELERMLQPEAQP
jgi:acyl-CoA synthetase (AMP-forming)/AMP-acid ligase II